jgi:hypothetical protein
MGSEIQSCHLGALVNPFHLEKNTDLPLGPSGREKLLRDSVDGGGKHSSHLSDLSDHSQR